jgi:hypothetical protein
VAYGSLPELATQHEVRAQRWRNDPEIPDRIVAGLLNGTSHRPTMMHPFNPLENRSSQAHGELEDNFKVRHVDEERAKWNE